MKTNAPQRTLIGVACWLLMWSLACSGFGERVPPVHLEATLAAQARGDVPVPILPDDPAGVLHVHPGDRLWLDLSVADATSAYVFVAEGRQWTRLWSTESVTTPTVQPFPSGWEIDRPISKLVVFASAAPTPALGELDEVDCGLVSTPAGCAILEKASSSKSVSGRWLRTDQSKLLGFFKGVRGHDLTDLVFELSQE